MKSILLSRYQLMWSGLFKLYVTLGSSLLPSSHVLSRWMRQQNRRKQKGSIKKKSQNINPISPRGYLSRDIHSTATQVIQNTKTCFSIICHEARTRLCWGWALVRPAATTLLSEVWVLPLHHQTGRLLVQAFCLFGAIKFGLDLKGALCNRDSYCLSYEAKMRCGQVDVRIKWCEIRD
jgi:hypothetical protein